MPPGEKDLIDRTVYFMTGVGNRDQMSAGNPADKSFLGVRKYAVINTGRKKQNRTGDFFRLPRGKNPSGDAKRFQGPALRRYTVPEGGF